MQGNLSSMYFLILSLAWFLRYDRSLFIVPNPTCRIVAISGWLWPWLDNFRTLLRRHSNFSICELRFSTLSLVKYDRFPYSRLQVNRTTYLLLFSPLR